jgi:hypothetical protein
MRPIVGAAGIIAQIRTELAASNVALPANVKGAVQLTALGGKLPKGSSTRPPH